MRLMAPLAGVDAGGRWLDVASGYRAAKGPADTGASVTRPESANVPEPARFAQFIWRIVLYSRAFGNRSVQMNRHGSPNWETSLLEQALNAAPFRNDGELRLLDLCVGLATASASLIP